MGAAYDSYNYKSYWKKREYEHKSEIYALKKILDKIDNIKSVIDIGAGYGRLTNEYLYRSKKVLLTDPSAKLLAKARKNIKQKKVKFLQSKIENLPQKLKNRKFDTAILIRVLHHIEDTDQAFKITRKILTDGGYLILEFANKQHLKKRIKEFLKGNFTFPIDIFPKDIRCQENISKKTLPFYNFHPDNIIEKLKNEGFEIIEKRSVSNLRNSFLKSLFPTEFLISIEKLLQKPLSIINFGPSIFILAKKGTIN